MNLRPRPTAVLDANVLYPAPLRDLLLHIAFRGLFQPKWTEQIQQEWVRNVLTDRADLTAAQLQKTVDTMNTAFPSASVAGYEPLMDALQLPDPDDRHVLAAAIVGRADVIITANLKDFPQQRLHPYTIEAQHPDVFICTLMETDPSGVREAFLAQVANLRNPPKTAHEVLGYLRKNGLEQTMQALLDML